MDTQNINSTNTFCIKTIFEVKLVGIRYVLNPKRNVLQLMRFSVQSSISELTAIMLSDLLKGQRLLA